MQKSHQQLPILNISYETQWNHLTKVNIVFVNICLEQNTSEHDEMQSHLTVSRSALEYRRVVSYEVSNWGTYNRPLRGFAMLDNKTGLWSNEDQHTQFFDLWLQADPSHQQGLLNFWKLGLAAPAQNLCIRTWSISRWCCPSRTSKQHPL